jgi:hypothetical protein
MTVTPSELRQRAFQEIDELGPDVRRAAPRRCERRRGGPAEQRQPAELMKMNAVL